MLFLKKSRMLFLFLYMWPKLSYALLWPVFDAPDKKFLLDHGYIDMSQCPRGQGKLVSNSRINIHNSLCSTYCPTSWNWIGKSDSKCYELNDFSLQHYTMHYFKEPDGTTLYSVVTAYYGQRNGTHSILTFTFVTPKEHWYCIEINSELHTLTCANDI